MPRPACVCVCVCAAAGQPACHRPDQIWVDFFLFVMTNLLASLYSWQLKLQGCKAYTGLSFIGPALFISVCSARFTALSWGGSVRQGPCCVSGPCVSRQLSRHSWSCHHSCSVCAVATVTALIARHLSEFALSLGYSVAWQLGTYLAEERRNAVLWCTPLSACARASTWVLVRAIAVF